MSDQPYTGPERRVITRSDIADMVAEEVDSIVANSQSSLMLHFDAKIAQMHVGMKAMTEEIVKAAVEAALKAHIEAAYPPGPLHKHKDHHQGLIDSAEQWKKIKTDIVTWAIRGTIAFVFYVIGSGAIALAQRELVK